MVGGCGNGLADKPQAQDSGNKEGGSFVGQRRSDVEVSQSDRIES